MESVWKNRNMGGAAARDLATCFKCLQDPVLLV
jgi:hypothetical protein